MTTMMERPRGTDAWTVDDLAGLPDDGLRYELLDGFLLVTPAPLGPHQTAVLEIAVLLRTAMPSHLKVYVAPRDWQPDRGTSFQPDVLIVRRDEDRDGPITAPLVLAVEVQSRSTRRKDQLLKYSKYADCGVASYWIVDPDEPSIVAYDLVDGAYVEVGRASGEERVTLAQPFEVTVTPKALVSG
ncbi:Uma2 family endonuclease [Jiangella alba]|uniref:Endonuclease, Uma2 family (Restriction endonuclease fold) n=1 Tax=Jiangella alba TaxID=561176 RepID=A0A1H5M8E2_9ACTN|nr:Uma2 family endonuclease [Jiangella alba]SEE85636.1 Endonuclease, Uma2 family (restriction endonuclease fold) [Jiangella alba]